MKPSNPVELIPGLAPGSSLLILRLRSLGDVVLLTPALAALHRARPDLRTTVAVEPEYVPVLEGNPAVSEILVVHGIRETAEKIRRHHFPVLYNQHGGPTSAFLTALSRVPVRVCWSDCQFPFFYNVRVPPAEHFYGPRKVHTVEHRMTQFYWTGLEPGPIPPAQVFPRPEALHAVERRLESLGVRPGQPYAVIHPGAAYFTKRWALENFAEIARWLREEQGVAPVICLGPDEQSEAGKIAKTFGKSSIIVLPAAMDLRQLIALISRARLFVGNDSGPAHLATAAGRPSVVIFGSSDSTLWRPWLVDHRVVQNDFPCNPCRGDRCYAFDEPRCILSVTLGQVRDACANLLAPRPGGMLAFPQGATPPKDE